MHLQKQFALVLLPKMLDLAGKVHHLHQPDLEVYTIVVKVVEQQGVQQGGPFVPRVAVEVVLKEPFVVEEAVQRADLPDLLLA